MMPKEISDKAYSPESVQLRQRMNEERRRLGGSRQAGGMVQSEQLRRIIAAKRAETANDQKEL